MFGDRKKLLLPIIFDIANLVRTAGTSSQNSFNRKYQETEAIPDPQYLRRSFTEIDRPINTTEIEITPSNLKDDRLQIDEADSLTKPRLMPATSSRPMETNSESRSFHERKLNMTNFQGSHDQFAMESNVPLTNMSFAYPAANITLEQYENLALSELNDTLVENQLSSSNGNSTEGLPTPEMLISRYRVKNPYRKNTVVHPHTGIDMRTCERFGTLCLRVEDYPM